MKIVQINSFSNGSTGKIMMSIHKELLNKGYDSYVVWGRGRNSRNSYEIYLNDKIGLYSHVLYSRLTGKNGFASKKATKNLIKQLEDLKPDIIHLHNIHGYYINIEILFDDLRKNNIKVIWTLHDCWAFTGQCAYFTAVGCDKWKNGCYNCPKINKYPKAFKDNSKRNYKLKRELFTGLDITIVTPSSWLAKLVRMSYLKEYKIKIIHNGIDLSVFKKSNSDFRKKYNLENKKIILGVASTWDKRKGLDDFIRLAKILDDNYMIVLVGLSEKQIANIPNNIIGITRTENQQGLVGIYSTADILFNPTYEDNYPTVNLEALACGTPVLSYDTGGSIEFEKFIKTKDINYVIKKENISKNINIIKEQIDKIINSKLELKNTDVLDEKKMVNEYIKLYNEEL